MADDVVPKLNEDSGVVGCLLPPALEARDKDTLDSTSLRINSLTSVGTTSTNCENISMAIVFIFSSLVFC